jgi:hypothetical protein
MIVTLSLVLIFGTVFSSSRSVFSDDMMGGTMDDGGNDGFSMPPPEDAPLTTDTLTSGGDSDNDNDDDDENDDDSGGSRDNNDDDDDNDEDKDSDKDDEPTSTDISQTTDIITANGPDVCPVGQEYYLFSMSCAPVSTDITTSPATLCPTSYSIPERLSVTNTVWGFSMAETGQQEPLLHKVQGSTGEITPADPTNCPPASNQLKKDYKPPASVLPYRGDEAKLIDFYANADPTDDTIVRIDMVDDDVYTTFADGTIKKSSTEVDNLQPDDIEQKSSDIVDYNIRITPGSGTPLDKLGVIQVEVPYSTNISPGLPIQVGHNIKYGDGDSIQKRVWTDDYTSLIHKDSKGKILQVTDVDEENRKTTVMNMQDKTRTVHPEGLNTYIEYPKAPEGTQKIVTMTSEGQPIVTVRDANGNVIPPK